jgi:phosphoenolpyruvate-protein phosphotransferase
LEFACVFAHANRIIHIMMPELRGIPVSPGYAEGVAWVHRPKPIGDSPHYSISDTDVEAQLRRFGEAMAATGTELERLRDRTVAEIGTDEAAIFDVQLAILGDAQFMTKVEDQVRHKKVNVERALIRMIEDWVETSQIATDERLPEQAQDLRDLGQRLIAHLTSRAGRPLVRLAPQSIVVARELLPSDIMELDRAHVSAIVTEWGGPTSHAAIIVRSLGIPAVTGLRGILDRIQPGQKLLVNGERGTVILEPTEAELALFVSHRCRYEQAISVMADLEGEPCVTLDGVHVGLYGNLSRGGEVEHVLEHHLEGVELLRTELLFFESAEPPALVDQCEAYRNAAEALKGRPLVIRTFDLGGDKIPEFLEPWAQANPKLSLRGLQFSLEEEHLLRTQLEAILDITQDYDIRVLFPMVMGSDDLCAAVDLLKDIAAKRGRRLPLIGAMIETPSVLFALEEIMPHVDFLSLGTNDLAQFMLGAERDAIELSEEHVAVYPTILRAIRRVVEAAEQAGRPLSVCGEMAGHPAIAPLLVGLGVRKLSMTPTRCVQVRYALRHCDCKEAEAIAIQALQCDSRHQVRTLLSDMRNGVLSLPKTPSGVRTGRRPID